jgi:hypothetical protein
MLTRSVACLAMVAAALLVPVSADAAVDVAKIMPNDLMLLAYAKDVGALREKFQKTSWHELYKDPAMAAVVGPIETKVQELIDKGFAEMAGELKMDKPLKEIPWPQGVAAVGMRLKVVTRQMPEYDYGNWDGNGPPPIKGMRQYNSTEPVVVGVVEMGKNIDVIKDIIKRAADKGVESGAKREVETVRGIELTVVSDGNDTLCWAVKDSLLVIGSDAALTKDVVARLGGQSEEPIADSVNYKALMRAVDEEKADVAVYFSVPVMLASVRSTIRAEERAEAEKVFTAMKLDQITGVAAGLTLAPSPAEDLRIKIFAGVEGAKAGLMAAIAPANAAFKPTRAMGKDTGMFLWANYDAGKLFDAITQMIADATGEDVAGRIKEGMAMTGGEGNTAPVDLRADVMGQLAAPIALVGLYPKPISNETSAFIFTVGVRDAGVLDQALGRLHAMFIARGEKDQKRDFNGTNIYLVPSMGFFFMPMMGRDRGEAEHGFAVAGDTFIFGKLGVIEQAIRDAKAKDKDKAESVADDPIFQAAAKLLPAQVGLVYYENAQLTTEATWKALKEMPKEEDRRSNSTIAPIEPFAQRQSGKPAPMMMMRAVTPFMIMGGLGRELQELVDFKALPDYDKIKHHFGASIMYMADVEGGLKIECISARPPKK